MSSAVRLVLLVGLGVLAAAGSRPARCIGGGDRLTICVETPPRLPAPYPPRRYDYGGLYGPEYFRNRYGGGRGVLAPPPPDYGVRYEYGVQTRPAFRPSPPVLRPSPPIMRPSPPVFRPSPPIAVDFGFERRSGYGTPGSYGRQYGYGGGFQPVVVVPEPPAAVPGPYPVVPRPTQPATRPFIIRPHVSGPQFPPHPDIRSFYNRANMLGRGQISTDGRNNVQFVCDFSRVGVTPATDVLTDVVWQKVGRPAYMNNPMTSVSAYPNLLSCPNTYVSPTQTNYGFNIAGSKTTLVIKNATSADYGVYRCYATRVSRRNPRQRTPVYMEVYYTPTRTTGRR